MPFAKSEIRLWSPCGRAACDNDVCPIFCQRYLAGQLPDGEFKITRIAKSCFIHRVQKQPTFAFRSEPALKLFIASHLKRVFEISGDMFKANKIRRLAFAMKFPSDVANFLCFTGASFR